MTNRSNDISLAVFHQPPRGGESIVLGTRMTHLVLHDCGHLWPHALNLWRSYRGPVLDPLNRLPCPACRRSSSPDAHLRFPGADWTEEFILNAAVNHLLSWTDLDEARRQHVTYGNPPRDFDCCSRPLAPVRMFVDGVHRPSGLWAFMCPACFLQLGRGLGDGLGQLFLLRDDGSWLQVAGFSAGEPKLTSEDVVYLFGD